MEQTEVLKWQMTKASLRARSLVWIRRQPSKLDTPGSNPGAPAISCLQILSVSFVFKEFTHFLLGRILDNPSISDYRIY